MADIRTLVDDMYGVIDGQGGWTEIISGQLGDAIKTSAHHRFNEEQAGGFLRLSSLGKPCERQLWYSVNYPELQEPLSPKTKMMFFYGDLLECLVINLAEAAGHKVEGQQDTLVVEGIKGHRDCVIDGYNIDVKSTSTFSFNKFKEGLTPEKDDFGYLSQLSSYTWASSQSDIETHPTVAGFLAVEKQFGGLWLDMHDLKKYIEKKPQEVIDKKKMVAGPLPPRGYEDVPDGAKGNRKLGAQCGYCGWKKECWPGLRGFAYANKPTYLTNVASLPNVREFKI